MFVALETRNRAKDTGCAGLLVDSSEDGEVAHLLHFASPDLEKGGILPRSPEVGS